jgi:UDP-N-acetyl-D-mannosaminuronic acid dehydrogenase
VFKSVPLAERTGKLVYDARGIWPDQEVPDDAASARLTRGAAGRT